MNAASITRWWQGLAPRERTIVGIGALIVFAVAVFALLWEPPAAGIRKLQVDLPQLRTERASMRAMADEATRLRGAAGAAISTAPNDRLAAVRRSLERAGLASAAGASPAPVVASSQGVPTLTVGGTTAPVTTVASSPVVRAPPPEVGADGERVRVRFDDVDYGVWIAWLAAAETELAARAVRVAVASSAPKGAVGHVRAEAWLDWTPSNAAPRS